MATNGVIHMNTLEMEDIVVSYFGSLFVSGSLSSPNIVLSLILTYVTDNMRISLEWPYEYEKVYVALTYMHPGS